MSKYLLKSVSNGNRREQALIRRWWHEERSAKGRMIWEYFMGGRYADGVLLCDDSAEGAEESGESAPARFPLEGLTIVLCEAKAHLTPELIGQALVYARFAQRAGAVVQETVVFAERGLDSMKAVAAELGLTVVVHALEDEGERLGPIVN